MVQYLKKKQITEFPKSINEEKILSFDSNFECGNLDSVYIQDINKYNLLMKTDTNTRGNTFWFMFKVSNF